MKLLEFLFGVLFPAFGYIVGFFSFLYYNKLRFFIVVNKIFKRKKDVNFSIEFDFDGEFSDLKKFKECFKKHMSHEFRIINSSRINEVFQIDNLIVSIKKSEFPDDEFKNNILIKNANSTYAMATKNLKSLQLIFKDIIKEKDIVSTRYCFKTNFNKQNPFISKSVTKVGVNNIKHFYMILSTSAFTSQLDNEEDIQINMNQVSYVADEFNELREVANIILAM